MEIQKNEMDYQSNPILISVIIPVYNCERFLPECLESIVHQTVKNIEIIVIDDGSTDLSYDLVLRYAAVDNRIKVYQIPNSGYCSKPRNIGMQYAKGEYIFFIDSDDKLEAHALELLYKKARRLNAEITLSSCAMFDQNGNIGPLIKEELKNDDVALPIKYRREDLFFFCVWGVLYETEFLKKSKLQFNENYYYFEDQAFVINALFLAKKITCVKETVYYYRKGHDSITATKVDKKSVESALLVLKEVEQLFLSKAKYLFKDYREILLEIKLARLECIEGLWDKPFYQSIMKTAEIFLPGDEEIIMNLLADGYKFFHMWDTEDKRDRYYKLFIKYFYKLSLPQQNKLALSKIPTLDKYPFKTNKEIIPIVFAANDYYVPYFECALLSLIQKASNEYNYHIVVLERDWVSGQKQSILNRYSAHNVAFTFYNTDWALSDFNTHTHHHFSIDTYARLRTPTILGTYDKCVYLDCDLIINDDISKFYQINLEECYLGAVLDYAANTNILRDYLNRSLGISTNAYFNAGVLLWDLKKSRENNLEESLLQISKARDYWVVDQDVMNIAFSEKVKFLDYRWNYPPRGNEMIGINNIEQLEAWDNIAEDFSIIHFTTREKPWLTRERDKADYFWNIAKQTMHYEIILKRYLHLIKSKEIQCQQTRNYAN